MLTSFINTPQGVMLIILLLTVLSLTATVWIRIRLDKWRRSSVYRKK